MHVWAYKSLGNHSKMPKRQWCGAIGKHIFHVLGDMGTSLEVGENDPQKGKKSHFGIPLAITLISFTQFL